VDKTKGTRKPLPPGKRERVVKAFLAGKRAEEIAKATKLSLVAVVEVIEGIGLDEGWGTLRPLLYRAAIASGKAFAEISEGGPPDEEPSDLQRRRIAAKYAKDNCLNAIKAIREMDLAGKLGDLPEPEDSIPIGE